MLLPDALRHPPQLPLVCGDWPSGAAARQVSACGSVPLRQKYTLCASPYSCSWSAVLVEMLERQPGAGSAARNQAAVHPHHTKGRRTCVDVAILFQQLQSQPDAGRRNLLPCEVQARLGAQAAGLGGANAGRMYETSGLVTMHAGQVQARLGAQAAARKSTTQCSPAAYIGTYIQSRANKPPGARTPVIGKVDRQLRQVVRPLWVGALDALAMALQRLAGQHLHARLREVGERFLFVFSGGGFGLTRSVSV